MPNNTKQYLVIGSLFTLVIVMAAIFVLPAAGVNLSTVQTGQSTTQVVNGEQVEVQAVQCSSDTSPSVTANIYDSTPGNTGTLLNSNYDVNFYAVNADGSLSYINGTTAGTAITLPKNTTVAMFAENSGATHNVYGIRKDFFVGCEPAITKNYEIGIQDAALTTAVYSVTGGDTTANTSGAETTIAAGGTASFKVNISTATKNARWGTTQEGAKALIVLDYNSDAFDEPQIGSAGTKVAVPQGHKATTVDANNDSSVAYEIDASLLADGFTQGIDVYFIADAAGDTVNPGDTANESIAITIYDKEMQKNDAGTYVVGYRDVDSPYADLGESNATDQFHVA